MKKNERGERKEERGKRKEQIEGGNRSEREVERGVIQGGWQKVSNRRRNPSVRDIAGHSSIKPHVLDSFFFTSFSDNLKATIMFEFFFLQITARWRRCLFPFEEIKTGGGLVLFIPVNNVDVLATRLSQHILW